jgi:hypothetical protein
MTTKTGSAMEVKVIQNEAGEGVSRYLLTTSSLGSFEVVLDGCVLRRHRGASNHPLKRGLASWTVSPYFFFFFFLCWALDTERAWQMLSARFLLSGWQENSA